MYVKIFEDILDSSVWEESLPTRVTWLTMLIMADEEGMVRASVSGIRRRAFVDLEDVREALRILSEPDADSKDKDHGGRRIQQVEGGFQVLNYKKYREIRTRKQRRDAERQAVYRAGKKRDNGVTPVTVTDVTTTENAYEHEVVVPSTPTTKPVSTKGGESERGVKMLPVPTRDTPITEPSQYEEAMVTVLLTDGRMKLTVLRRYGIWALFIYWGRLTKNAGSQLDRKRWLNLERWVKAYPLSQMFYCVDGALEHPDQKNSETGEPYHQVNQIFKDADRVENRATFGGWQPGRTHPMLEKYPKLKHLDAPKGADP